MAQMTWGLAGKPYRTMEVPHYRFTWLFKEQLHDSYIGPRSVGIVCLDCNQHMYPAIPHDDHTYYACPVCVKRISHQEVVAATSYARYMDNYRGRLRETENHPTTRRVRAPKITID